MIMSELIIDAVRSRYEAIAKSGLSSDHGEVRAVAEAFGYAPFENKCNNGSRPIPPPAPLGDGIIALYPGGVAEDSQGLERSVNPIGIKLRPPYLVDGGAEK
jgi:hypothetical protein